MLKQSLMRNDCLGNKNVYALGKTPNKIIVCEFLGTESDGDGDLMQCRICKDFGYDRNDFIVPCLCAGKNKFVHKHCLDRWRATLNSHAFTTCPTCKFDYHLEEIVQEVPAEIDDGCLEKCCSRENRFFMLVTRDFFVGFFVTQVWLLGLAVVIRLIDDDEHIAEYWPWDNDPHKDVWYAINHHKAPYYACSVFITLLMVLIYMTMFENETPFQNDVIDDCCDCCCCCFQQGTSRRRNVRRYNAKHRSGASVYYGNPVFPVNMIQRRIVILQRRQLAREFRVVDMEKAGRLLYNDIDPTSPYYAKPPPPEHLEARRTVDELLMTL